MKNLSIYIVGLTLISMGIGIASGGYSIEFDPESEPCTKRKGGGNHELKSGRPITNGPYPISGYDCDKYLKSKKCKHCGSNQTVEIEYKGNNCPRSDGPPVCPNEGTASL